MNVALASLPPIQPRIDQARRMWFGWRVFGQRWTPGNVRVVAHHLRRKYVDGREVPVAAVFGLTYRCQCACVHCSVEAGPDRDTSGELPYEEKQRVLRDLRDVGVVKVTFFGGEPLAYSRVYELATYGTSLGLRISIDTNGVLLSERNVGRIREAGVSNVNVSLDSPTPEEHDRLRKYKGAYMAALAGLRRLALAGVPALLSTYVTRDTLHNGDFERTLGIARENGARGVKVLLPMVAGRWHERPDQALSAEDESKLRTLLDPGFAYVEDAFQNVLDGSHVCTAVRKLFVYISPHGDLQPCPAVPVRFGSLRKQDLRAAIDKMWSHKAFDKDCGICAMNFPEFRQSMGLPAPGEGQGRQLVDAK